MMDDHSGNLVKGLDDALSKAFPNPGPTPFSRPRTTHARMDVEGYSALAAVLIEAYEQAARGKGRARHAGSPVGFRPWAEQPILQIGRMAGPGYSIGQVMKKAQEAFSMLERGEFDAARAELLGVIVYAASAHVLSEELQEGRGATAPSAS